MKYIAFSVLLAGLAMGQDIAGGSALFERWAEKGSTEFLVTAKNPRGGAADPPMRAYHLTQQDAEAIVAYLKSLP